MPILGSSIVGWVRQGWGRPRRGLLLAIACCLLLAAGCSRPRSSNPVSSPSSPQLPSQTAVPGMSDPQSSLPPSPAPGPLFEPAVLPPLQLDRMIQDLENISGERHREGARDRTRRYLRRSLQNSGWQVEEQRFATGVNLVATWPTAERSSERPAEPSLPLLLVGAHYDTVAGSPGADDNGTGVAALLEIGRVSAQVESLARTLMLVFFDREEQGLEGSLAFATPERVAQLRGAIVLEMLGFTCQTAGCQSYPDFLQQRPMGDRGDFIAVVGDAEHPELLRAFETPDSLAFAPVSPGRNSRDREPVRDPVPLFSLSVPLKGVLMPDVLRSDHAPFWLRGLGAVMVTDTANLRNPHYHRASDRPETLDLDFWLGVTQRVAGAIVQLQSSLSSPPPR